MASDDTALTFRVLLYRYLFFGWLFCDVSQGNLFERSAAWRHNLDKSCCLATYLRRWVVFGLVSFALGALLEHGLSAQWVSAFFYVSSALSVVVNTVISVLIVGFKLLPAPL